MLRFQVSRTFPFRSKECECIRITAIEQLILYRESGENWALFYIFLFCHRSKSYNFCNRRVICKVKIKPLNVGNFLGHLRTYFKNKKKMWRKNFAFNAVRIIAWVQNESKHNISTTQSLYEINSTPDYGTESSLNTNRCRRSHSDICHINSHHGAYGYYFVLPTSKVVDFQFQC